MLTPRSVGGRRALLALALVLAVGLLMAVATTMRSDEQPDGGGCLVTAWSGLPVTSDEELWLVDEVAATGVTILRVELVWADLQPRPPVGGDDGVEHWKLDLLDRLVDRARSRGLDVQALVTYAPAWATGAPDTAGTDLLADGPDPGDDPTALPRSHRFPTDDTVIRSFGDFMRLVAARYEGRISGYEIWNEPNLARFLAPGGAGPSGAPAGEAELMGEPSWDRRVDLYARLLTVAGGAVHERSSARVALGGVSTSARDDGVDVPAGRFVDGVLGRVPAGLVDAVAVHTYTPGSGPLAMPDASQEGNEFAVARGIGERTGLPLWITEFGAPALPQGVDPSSVDPASNLVPEDVQRDKLLAGIDQARRMPGVEEFAVYQPVDRPEADTHLLDPEAHFGLRRADGTEKAAWGPVTAALRQAGCR